MSSFASSAPALPLLQAVSFVWAGLILGISFLEAPVKFTTPSLSRPTGLDVGRHVFAALNKVEIGVGLISLGLLFVVGPRFEIRWVLTGVLVILACQTACLLPRLREQAEAIIQGGKAPDSNYAHVAYIFLEVAKVAGLLYSGWFIAP